MFSPCVIKNAMANNMTTSHTGSIKVQLRRPMHVDPPKALVYSYLEGGRGEREGRESGLLHTPMHTWGREWKSRDESFIHICDREKVGTVAEPCIS